MYNEERKRQFLAEKSENAIISKNLEITFEATAEREERLGRDICEWTSQEIISYYKYLSTPYVQSLIQLHNGLSNYATWCMINGLIKNNQNHYLEIKTETLLKCTDVNKLVYTAIKREDLLDEIKLLQNESDKFIILGLFEGIPITDDVMKNVKVSDLNGNTLRLSNGMCLDISPELVHYLYMADEEDGYQAFGKREIIIPYQPEDTVIKHTINNKAGSNSTVVIGARFRRCIKFLEMPEGTTIKTIRESGRLDLMKKISDKYNVEMEDTITTPHLRELHEKIYGKIQNQMTYLNTWGKCFDK